MCQKNIPEKHYEGVVGVACTDELKLASTILEHHSIHAQGIPLIKNGCSETRFNFEILEQILTYNGKNSPERQNPTKAPSNAPQPQNVLM